MKKIKFTNNMKVGVFLGLYIITIVGGACAIYGIMNPAPTPKPWTWNGVLMVSTLLCSLGVLFHGFHPILLVKR